MTGRRFPAPWTVEEYRGISYIVRDANDFPVAYVYFESEPGRRAAAKLMTKDEARKIAAGIAKLPAVTSHTNTHAAVKPNRRDQRNRQQGGDDDREECRARDRGGIPQRAANQRYQHGRRITDGEHGCRHPHDLFRLAQ